MGFIQNLFKPAAPKAPAFQPPPVPGLMSKITAPTAVQIAQQSNPSPAAQQLLTPQQTPSQYLSALQEKQMGDEMVKTMAHGLPDREGVHWAAQSAEKVSDKLPPDDVQAMKAAQAWAKNPTEANQAAAAAAAAKTNLQGPGALAAQGAAWAQPSTPAAAPAGVVPAVPRLTPLAVSGAVLLAAAIKANPALAAPKAPALQAPTLPAQVPATPQLAATQVAPPTVPPSVQAQMFKEQHPFIALGLDVASGKTPVA